MLSLFLAFILENFDDPTKVTTDEDDPEASVFKRL